jgi:hemoglobin
MAKKLYEELGGLDKLREIINTFVDRMFDDIMIGFFFRKTDKERIKEKEFEFTAQVLGADIKYSGTPIAEVHQKHPIMGGQFSRRTQIFKETLQEYEVPPHIIEKLLNHTESLRMLIAKTRKSDCNHETAMKKIQDKI